MGLQGWFGYACGEGDKMVGLGSSQLRQWPLTRENGSAELCQQLLHSYQCTTAGQQPWSVVLPKTSKTVFWKGSSEIAVGNDGKSGHCQKIAKQGNDWGVSFPPAALSSGSGTLNTDSLVQAKCGH